MDAVKLCQSLNAGTVVFHQARNQIIIPFTSGERSLSSTTRNRVSDITHQHKIERVAIFIGKDKYYQRFLVEIRNMRLSVEILVINTKYEGTNSKPTPFVP